MIPAVAVVLAILLSAVPPTVGGHVEVVVGTDAQTASAVATPIPLDGVPPSDCTVEPRSADDVLTIVDAAYSTDFAITTIAGPVQVSGFADTFDAVVDGVTWVDDGVMVTAPEAIGSDPSDGQRAAAEGLLRELSACSNTRNALNFLALYTDAGVASHALALRTLGPPFASPEWWESQVRDPGGPSRSPSDWDPAPAVVSVRVLPDGHLGVVVLYAEGERAVGLLRLEDGRYLLDRLPSQVRAVGQPPFTPTVEAVAN